ncbi:hypothetical protein YC2023_117583 [Brassica napus]
MSNTRTEVDQFDGRDFTLWKVWMLAHFGVLSLEDIRTDEKLLKDASVTKDKPESTVKDLEKGLAEIVESTSVMDPIKFEKSEKAKDLIVLNLRFYTFKMAYSKTIDDYVDDFLKLLADLSNLQVEVSEEVQDILLLSSLPNKYDQLKETLKCGRAL